MKVLACKQDVVLDVRQLFFSLFEVPVRDLRELKFIYDFSF